MYKIIEKVEVESRNRRIETPFVRLSKLGCIHFSQNLCNLLNEHKNSFDVVMVANEKEPQQKLFAIALNTEGGYTAKVEGKGLKISARMLAKKITEHYNLDLALTAFNSHRFEIEIQNGLIILLPPKKYGK